MNFNQKLQQLVEDTEGGIACILMGRDGLAIDSYESSNQTTTFNSSTFGIEFTNIFNQLIQMTKQTHFDTPRELTIHSNSQVAIFHLLTEEYFILLTLTAEGNSGKGRYLLRKAVPLLQQELFS